MKIGIEAQRIFRQKKHGMDFVALETIRHLQKIDTENQYVIFTNEGDDTACLRETANFKIVTFGGSYPLWEQIKLPRQVKKHGCELLHCTSNTAPVFCPVPLVVTVHDIIYFETHPLFAKGYSLYQRFGNLYRRFVVRRNLKRAQRIITVSHFEKRRFQDFLKLPDGRVDVVYNGVGSHFKPVEDAAQLQNIKKKYQLPERYFLFLGNTDPKKNTPTTLRAFAEYCRAHGRTHYLVVADLDSAVVRKGLAAAQAEAFFDQVHFTGYIKNTDLPAVIQQAEAFLYPSRRESFGIPILEAMGVGTAVVTSQAASMPEVAGGAAILINPAQPKEIADALARLAGQRELRRDLSKKGRQRAAQFSWEQTAQATFAIYKEVLEND